MLCRFGLVYPGVGWVIFRDRAALPDDMVLMTSYLGRPEPTVSINFSRNAAQVAASYYNVRPDTPIMLRCNSCRVQDRMLHPCHPLPACAQPQQDMR